MPKDPAILAHQEWIGYVQPTGLVVSIPALVDASAFLNRNYGPDHQRFLSALPQDADHEVIPEIPDFVQFARDVLNWDASLLNGSPEVDPIPAELEVNLENYNETLRPRYALRNLEGERKWLLLVDVFPAGTDLDQPFAPHDRAWQVSPQARFEKLLRQTGVGIGLLVNGREIRLVYAPEKELSGYITFKLAEMVRVAGRPIFAALRMLLDSERLYSVAEKERLPAILVNSRKYQNVVSTQLAEQVLEALYEMLRGFQAANDQTKGELLREVLARDPDHVYHGLLTTLLRLVFVLYAEDRALLSTDPVYSNYYSVRGLYERLRADSGRYNDTMDQRYGAWAQLLALFRLVYSGGSHGGMKIPAREGYLFDPDRYLFLEGRHDKKDKAVIPRVSDGVLYRVLSNLVLLDGERLSYRWLAVEQIGSVYQAIMGFSLEVATGRSIAIRPAKKHGAPATVNLEALLSTAPDKRLKRFTDETDQKLTGPSAEALKLAATIEDLMAALERKIAKTVTPVPVPKDAMVFQPSDERRKSGSHYTPSSLTGPIVEAALEPVLKQLGPNPTPSQILSLKVCDLAMGSAAFLVEACRQLGDALTRAWQAHQEVQIIPPDEDEALYAQRQIAQRCLYGLDKNQMAADLAKLSLWLATLAKDHPFTFLDHSLRHGDALVGLTRKQIAAYNWDETDKQQSFLEEQVRQRVERVSQYRQRILAARDDVPYTQLKQELEGAEESLQLLRQVGDTVIAAFFSADKPKARNNARLALRHVTELSIRNVTHQKSCAEIEQALAKLHRGPKGIRPFHWELEFPEVFSVDEHGQQTGGFDVIVGNPPFLGGMRISEGLGMPYFAWLNVNYAPAEHLCDMVAYFFRRSFNYLKEGGCLGLIATNTIAQGDTREGGLAPILGSGGLIYSALRRLKWPGEAAVVVSRLHISKCLNVEQVVLDNKIVRRISAFLLAGNVDRSPSRLAMSPYFSQGSNICGQGFLFDDNDPDANPDAVRRELITANPRYASRILPYIGGENINSDPVHAAPRHIICLSDLKTIEELNNYPELAEIVRLKVKPERDSLGNNPNNIPLKKYWWAFQAHRPELYARAQKLKRILANSRVSSHLAFAFLPTTYVFSDSVNVFEISGDSGFGVVQSRVHETWARFFASSLEDRLRYTPSDCFETFPFPESYESNTRLEHAAKAYYDFRADLMIRNNEGLTKTYNRFHDPNEDSPDIQRLRELHAAMDREVLDTYGWHDIQPVCQFFAEFDDEEDREDNGRPKRKKYRYRWPEEVRDEVLARLLDLNRQRAPEGGQTLTDSEMPVPTDPGKKTRKKRSKAIETTDQIAIELGEL